MEKRTITEKYLFQLPCPICCLNWGKLNPVHLNWHGFALPTPSLYLQMGKYSVIATRSQHETNETNEKYAFDRFTICFRLASPIHLPTVRSACLIHCHDRMFNPADLATQIGKLIGRATHLMKQRATHFNQAELT